MADPPSSRALARANTPAVLPSVRGESVVGRAFNESDLLVAALRDHIRDLQLERELLRAEVDDLRQRVIHAEATSIWGRMKPPRA